MAASLTAVAPELHSVSCPTTVTLTGTRAYVGRLLLRRHDNRGQLEGAGRRRGSDRLRERRGRGEHEKEENGEASHRHARHYGK